MGTVTSADAASDSTEARRELARAVRSRRLELGLSVRAAAETAGLARGTWIALEEASRRTTETAYAGIERTLHWAAGSVASVLTGGEVTEQEHGRAVSVQFAPGHTQGDVVPALSESQDPLVRVMRSDLPGAKKRRIIELLLAERRQAERRLAEHAEELISLLGDEQ